MVKKIHFFPNETWEVACDGRASLQHKSDKKICNVISSTKQFHLIYFKLLKFIYLVYLKVLLFMFSPEGTSIYCSRLIFFTSANLLHDIINKGIITYAYELSVKKDVVYSTKIVPLLSGRTRESKTKKKGKVNETLLSGLSLLPV